MSIVEATAVGIDDLLGREWLVTNQIGGYASSTAAGLNTRKYHGLLVAAMSPPVRRMVLLSRVEESLVVAGREPILLSCSEYPGTIHPDGYRRLRAFGSDPFPRWIYQADGFTIQKTLRLIRGQNTVVLSYTLLGGNKSARLELRPLLALRGMHELTYQWNGALEAHDRSPGHYRIGPTSRTPEVFLAHDGKFEPGGHWYMSTIYRRECQRGYAGLEDLWMPGVIRWTIKPGQTVHLVCSADPIETDRVLSEAQRQNAQSHLPATAGAVVDPALDALLRAAEQFIVDSPRATVPATKPAMHVITQYPWSAPSGRDALIALPGLLLVPRRFEQARDLLELMASHMRDGVMPSEFPEDGSAPRYAGADTSLWFIYAVQQYLRWSGDLPAVRERFFDVIVRIIRCCQAGTELGIGIDADGLIFSHAPGAGTSWMDAKVGDWVVTPRQGRSVELNALWYNALCVTADLCGQFGPAVWAGEFTRLADSVRLAFNRRFWNELAGCCFDVVNDRGADPSIRPNQIFAISLPHAVLAPQRQVALLHQVRSQLLTPYGLRTLAPADPSYRGRYEGDVVSRDRAYHQGSVYPWLLGPLADAMIRVYGPSDQSRSQVRKMLEPCLNYLQQDGLGQLCELFDGEAPHHAGGAVASARSIAQVLYAYVEHVLDRGPQALGADVRFAPASRPAVEA